MKTLDRWRNEDPCDGVATLSRSLPNGVWLNLIVDNVDASLAFQKTVLGADVIYADDAFALVAFVETYWMVHSKKTYEAHPLYPRLPAGAQPHAGLEIRVQGANPDAAAQTARRDGHRVVQEPTDTEHGLRETFILDPDGYVWVPSIPVTT